MKREPFRQIVKILRQSVTMINLTRIMTFAEDKAANSVAQSTIVLKLWAKDQQVKVDILAHGGLGLIGKIKQDGAEIIVKTVLVPQGKTIIDISQSLKNYMYQFLNEIEMQKIVAGKHPEITAIPIDYTTFGTFGVFSMQSLPGKNLHILMSDPMFDAREHIPQITKGIINCVKNLEDCKIVHLDVKTDNFIYNEDDRSVKIIDFGHSKPFTRVESICKRAYSKKDVTQAFDQNPHFKGLLHYCTVPAHTQEFHDLIRGAERNSAALVLYHVLAKKYVTFDPNFEKPRNPYHKVAKQICLFGAKRVEQLCQQLNHNAMFRKRGGDIDKEIWERFGFLGEWGPNFQVEKMLKTMKPLDNADELIQSLPADLGQELDEFLVFK